MICYKTYGFLLNSVVSSIWYCGGTNSIPVYGIWYLHCDMFDPSTLVDLSHFLPSLLHLIMNLYNLKNSVVK